MKKLIAILSALFLFPFTALALTPMQDAQMNDVTGQAGVSIAIDTHVAMHVDTIAWGDADGAQAGDAAGWVGVSDMNGAFFVGLRDDHATNYGALSSAFNAIQPAIDAVIAAQAAYDANPNATTQSDLATAQATLDGTVATLDPAQQAQFDAWMKMENVAMEDLEVLTIDVGSNTEYSTYSANPGTDYVSYVRIGLGTFQVAGDMNMDFEMGTGRSLGQQLGTLDIEGMVVRGGTGGYVDITTEGRSSGVTLAMNVLIDQITIDSLAWGDSDGIANIYANTTNATGGYVGLANLYINDLTINGKVGIDVVNLADTAAIYAELAPTVVAGTATYKEVVLTKLTGLMNANAGDLSNTQVILSLGNADGIVDLGNDISVSMGTMNATVALGTSTSLDASTDILGSIYVAGATATVDGLVSISAH